jgi:hypothetical protein
MPDRYCETESEKRVRLTCAFDLEPRQVEWLWVGRVPLGMIAMFAGDPKLKRGGRATANIESWVRSPMSVPAAPIISSSLILMIRPVGAP